MEVPRGGALLAGHRVGSAVGLIVGAALYAAVEGLAKANFDLTPLVVGGIAIAAGLLGRRLRLVAIGLVLGGWGAAVLGVDHGMIPAARTTPAYMLGIGAGLLLTARLAPTPQRGAWLTSGAVAAFLGPLGLYVTYDVPAVGEWQAWALALVAWALWELFWSWQRPLLEAESA
ncbi:MAG: hypothetical protein NVS3B21_31190 [Acidimicrobiales bacterium]